MDNQSFSLVENKGFHQLILPLDEVSKYWPAVWLWLNLARRSIFNFTQDKKNVMSLC